MNQVCIGVQLRHRSQCSVLPVDHAGVKLSDRFIQFSSSSHGLDTFRKDGKCCYQLLDMFHMAIPVDILTNLWYCLTGY